MKIPFVDLGRMHRPLDGAFREAVDRVVAAGDFVLGGAVERFERRFAEYCGSAHAVGVGSGTGALHLALLACGVGPGDEVITVPNSFIATAFAVSYTGATPVFVDVDPGDFQVDAEAVAAAVTPRTRAILPVHLYGAAAPMRRLAQVAAERGLLIVEDACQAHGMLLEGRRAGSIGIAGAFSFFPAKNLGAFGDGGAVVTDDPRIAERLLLLRNYGSPRKYEHLELGFNCRLDTVQAAVLAVKLAELDRWNAERRDAAARYRAALAGSGIGLPPESPVCEPVYHLFVVRVGDRDRVRAELERRGIGTGIHYPVPLHLTPAYRGLGHGPGSFPVAERLAGEVLSLPMFPGITAEEVDTVAAALREVAPPPP